MSNEPVGNKLKALLHRIKLVEKQLDAATGALDEFQEEHSGSNFLETDDETDLKAFTIDSGVEALTKAASRDGSKLKLLLIDDDYLDRILIKEALTVVKNSLDFVELEDGSNVVDVIKREKPSATLLDIRMPIIDGFDVLNLIRNDEELAQHPVWILSTSSEENDMEMARRFGANGYYAKPDSVDEYSKIATQILENVAA